MAIIKCKMCGGELSLEEGSTVCECEYCGSKQTVPNADNEKKTNLFNRANRLRMNCEFDKASAVYESIAAEFPEEAEAYWGLCLCNYGIEYVDDPASGEKKPTCHRTLPGSIMEDGNFEQACDCADAIARRIYRDEAKAIDRIQKDILSIASSEAPYDVFICYKETAEEGGRTEDSVLAQDIYDALTSKGMKVFFSRITLEDKLGLMYEPYIYAALSSAKVMIAVGTRFEYYDAVWVKNEWSRFLSMMKTDKTKTLIPCFKGLDAYDMPKEFKGLQAQDMGKLGWLQDLVRGVEKLCGKNQAVESAAQPQTIIQQVSSGGPNVAALLDCGKMALEDGKWDDARDYFNRVLDMDSKNAEAYLGLAMEAAQKKNINEYGNAVANGMETGSEHSRAKQFAPQELLEKIEKFEKQNAERPGRIDTLEEEIAKIKNGEFSLTQEDEQELEALKQSAMEAKKKAEDAENELSTVPAFVEAQRIENEISGKRNQLAGLGLFKGKEKKMLQEQIDALEVLLANKKATVSEKQAEVDSLLKKSDEAQKKVDSFKKDRMIRIGSSLVAELINLKFSAPDKGSQIEFGHYNNGESIPPIKWRVLDKKANRILLLSEYALDCKPYNSTRTDVTWETCSLRSWLNGPFINAAFSPEELALISETTVTADKNPKYSTDPGNNTIDKVFLLSINEAERYFSGDGARKCVPTAYATAKGAFTNDKSYYGSIGICSWWLRSPGNRQDRATNVGLHGSVSFLPTDVNDDFYGVRPALWINLPS